MEKKFWRTVPSDWSQIREIREVVRDELSYLPEDIRNAAAMTSSELLENSIKYADTARAPYTVFLLAHSSREVRIVTNNKSGSAESYRQLSEHIGQFVGNDPRELYLRRLHEILADDGARGKLGLYRVAFEAGFELQCEAIAGTVTVTATRKMS